eukprot:5320229-Pyramimonas_sp.AAC.1
MRWEGGACVYTCRGIKKPRGRRILQGESLGACRPTGTEEEEDEEEEEEEDEEEERRGTIEGSQFPIAALLGGAGPELQQCALVLHRRIVLCYGAWGGGRGDQEEIQETCRD